MLPKSVVRGLKWYNLLLMEKPVRTSSFTAAVLGGLGDLINQVFLEQKPKEAKAKKLNW